MASDTPDHLEGLMAGNETVELTVKGTRERDRRDFEKYFLHTGIRSEEGRAGYGKYVILQAETGKDIRENVFFAFAEKKTPILRMETRKVSLEDVFLELTREKLRNWKTKRRGRAMRAIYKREFQSYSPRFHDRKRMFVALLVVFSGIYFMAYNLNMGYPYFSYSLAGSLMVYLVAIPILTMRSFSEERKNKTDQLLLTAPVSLV
ncbi:MAG: hypothetical protein ACLR2O_08900 [Coprococcus sp.]